jgi:hypothetical protein
MLSAPPHTSHHNFEKLSRTCRITSTDTSAYDVREVVPAPFIASSQRDQDILLSKEFVVDVVDPTKCPWSTYTITTGTSWKSLLTARPWGLQSYSTPP